MSSQTNMQAPVYPPSYYYDPTDTSKILENINNTERNITAGLGFVSKDINQTALGLRDAVER